MHTRTTVPLLILLAFVRPGIGNAQESSPAVPGDPVTVSADAASNTPPASTAPATMSAATATPPFAASLGSALQALPRDIWHSVSFGSATTAAIGLAAAGLAHHWDGASLEEAQEVPGFRSAGKPGNIIGSFAVQGGLSVGAYALGRMTDHPRIAQTGLDALRAQIVTQAWVQAIKISVHRQRPDGTRFSFPSGHVATTFATAEVVRRDLGWKAGVPMYALGVYVASARMAQNHHYLSDVLFGAAIGLASAHSLRLGHGPAALTLTPVAVPGGAAVQVGLAGRQ